MHVVNVILGGAQLFLICLILYQEIRKNSPAVFLWATLLIMFGFPHLSTTIFGDTEYGVSTIILASLFVIAFCLLYLMFRSRQAVAYLSLVGTKGYTLKTDGGEKTLFSFTYYFLIFIAHLYYLLFLIKVEGGIANTSWRNLRSITSSYVSLSGIAIRIIIALSGLILFSFLYRQRMKSVALVLLLNMVVFVTRNRVLVIPLLIFFISLFLLKIKSISIKHVALGLTLSIVVIYLVYGIRAFRHLGTLSDAFGNFSFEYLNKKIKTFLMNQDGELGLRRIFYYFIQNDNAFEGFNKGYTYIRLLLVYLPSKIALGLKPMSFDLYMGKAIGMAPGGSTHPTLFGDCFGNLYWFGIFLGAFWAGVANLFDRMISSQKENIYKILIYFLVSYSYVVGGRGSVYNGFQATAWGILIIFILKWMSPSLSRIRMEW